MYSETQANIIREMRHYLQEFLERPHPLFGNLPVCPFVRQARLDNHISYAVYPFSAKTDLQADSSLTKLAWDFGNQDRYKVLWIIHPHKQAMSPSQMRNFVAALNRLLVDTGLIAFGGHPKEKFNIHGVYTRREPYLNLTVQTQQSVKEASEILMKTSYYQNWSAAALQAIGWPR